MSSPKVPMRTKLSATKQRGSSLLILVAFLPVFGACGGDSPTSPSPDERVNAVIVSGPTALNVGATAQFTAAAALLDGSSRAVTADATWQSSNTEVARVERGIVTGVAAGEAEITARYQNATGRTRLAVATVPCSFTVSPTAVSISAAGGTTRVSVFAGANCGWAAVGDSPFATITSGASGTGNGATTLVVSANTGDARSAVFTIAGRQVTVSQGAGNCVTSVSPSSVEYSAELKRGTVTVTAPPGCQWTATSSSPGIGLGSFTPSGTGNGSFTYRAFGNLTGAPRSSSIQVLRHTVSVAQRAAVGGSFLSFVSDTGDFIGQGWTLLLETPTSTLTPRLDPSRRNISFSIVGSDGLSTLSWTLDLAAPQGQQLVPGTYLSATRYPFQAPTVPGLTFSGDGRGCNQLSGQFTITEAVYGGDGSVQRFRVTFEQHCEGAAAALRGTLFYVR
jgi:hypothetical protein